MNTILADKRTIVVHSITRVVASLNKLVAQPRFTRCMVSNYFTRKSKKNPVDSFNGKFTLTRVGKRKHVPSPTVQRKRVEPESVVDDIIEDQIRFQIYALEDDMRRLIRERVCKDDFVSICEKEGRDPQTFQNHLISLPEAIVEDHITELIQEEHKHPGELHTHMQSLVIHELQMNGGLFLCSELFALK